MLVKMLVHKDSLGIFHPSRIEVAHPKDGPWAGSLALDLDLWCSQSSRKNSLDHNKGGNANGQGNINASSIIDLTLACTLGIT